MSTWTYEMKETVTNSSFGVQLNYVLMQHSLKMNVLFVTVAKNLMAVHMWHPTWEDAICINMQL